MIVELALGLGVVALGWGTYRTLRSRRDRRDPGEQPEVEPARQPGGLAVGDVLLYGTEELWLAGRLVLRGDVEARIYVAPGAARERWIGEVHLPAGTELALLEPETGVSAGRAPDELRVGGTVLRARSRTQAQVTSEGEALPAVTERAELVIWTGAGGRIALLVDFVAGDRIALSGERLDRAWLTHLPGS